MQDRPHPSSGNLLHRTAKVEGAGLPYSARATPPTAAASQSVHGKDVIDHAFPNQAFTMTSQSVLITGETLAATLQRERAAALIAMCKTGAAALSAAGLSTYEFASESGSAVLRSRLDIAATRDRRDYLILGAVLANTVLTTRQRGVDCEVSLLPAGIGGSLVARLTPTVLAPSTELETQMAAALAVANDRAAQAAAWNMRDWPSPRLLGMLRRAARDSGAWLDPVIDDARRTLIADIAATIVHLCTAERCARDIAFFYGTDSPTPIHRDPLRTALSRLGAAVECNVPADELHARCAIMRSSLLVVLGSPGDGPQEWMRTGIALQRLLLLASGAGLCADVHSEVGEQPAEREALAALVFARGRPQVVVHFHPVTLPAP